MQRNTIGYLATARSSNTKTGDVPQIAIGTTREESIASCQMAQCDFLAPKHGGKGGTLKPDGTKYTMCYAHYGTPAMGHSSSCRAYANGKDRTLSSAITNSVRSARMLRLASIGDPGALSCDDGEDIRTAVTRAAMTLIGYIHGWKRTTPEVQQWRGKIMASCDTLAEADDAIAAGWRPAVVLPSDHQGNTFETPAGTIGQVCLAQRENSRSTCNTCRLCDGSKPGAPIGFIDHSPGVRK